MLTNKKCLLSVAAPNKHSIKIIYPGVIYIFLCLYYIKKGVVYARVKTMDLMEV